ncbi:MAG TPA: HAMP domain-containing sensor histidine kinase [Terriglobia bacterium]|nr:HAMP domain-containing sensor histidine kinase [Terriglobia bacterium]
MSSNRFQHCIWRVWERFFKLTESFGARLLGVSILAALGFLTVYALQGTHASQIPVVTIIDAILMALCGGAGLGFLYTLLLGAAIDYFFIPPIGQALATSEAKERYFLVTLTAALVGLLVSSLRMAFQRSDSAVRVAETAVRDRDEMVAVISHELKNPITALQTGTALIQRLIPRVPENEQVVNLVEKLPLSIQRMSALVSDLLDLAQLEGRALKLAPSDCSLIEIAQEVVASSAPMAVDKSVDLRITEFPSETMAFCDRNRTAQVLANLLSNAIKFTDAGGKVLVSARRRADQVEISVVDTGRGVPQDCLPYVFDRFWQAKDTAYKGTGLGLAIAKGLVEAQGGTLKVTSEVGHGSCFYFTLPGPSSAKKPA